MSASAYKLVLVDDDTVTLRFVEKVLRDTLGSRVEILAFSDSSVAQRWLAEHRCDILVSDIQMPKVDGQKMLRFAKKQNAWTQVVFLTGHSSWDHLADAIENGAADYILKPLDPNEVAAIIGQTVDRLTRWRRILTMQPTTSA